MPKLGPGTVTFGAGTAKEFSAEVTGVSVEHSYDETERKATLADTSKPAPVKSRGADALSIDFLNDLTSSGYYAYAYANDLTESPFVFIPSTASGAKWEGTVTVTLPDSIGAGTWGDDIESSVTLTGSPFDFTPEGAAAPIKGADLDSAPIPD